MKFIKPLLLAAAFTFIAPPMGKLFAASFPPFIHGHNICALNVNKFLRHIGRTGTNSASAASFLRWQRVSIPRYGDVVVNYRKGGMHSQIYLANGQCANPSSTHRKWVAQSCNASWRGQHKIYLRSK